MPEDPPPPGLLEALQSFTEKCHWLIPDSAKEDGVDTGNVRVILAEWDDLEKRWLRRVKHPRIRQRLDSLYPIIRAARARVRFMFLSDLFKLLDIRKQWRLAEFMLKFPAVCKKTLETAAPDQREKLQAVLSSSIGKKFDAAEQFTEAMNEADAWEKTWHHNLRTFKKAWEDQLTPQTERRLNTLTDADMKQWCDEIREEVLTLQVKHPEILGNKG
jgi:diadenosine tetraphosphatase ApaH/serine/threonine PP2A family protein phosphatase